MRITITLFLAGLLLGCQNYSNPFKAGLNNMNKRLERLENKPNLAQYRSTWEHGVKRGINKGWKDAFPTGRNLGYLEGRKAGWNLGWSKGWVSGYEDGVKEGLAKCIRRDYEN